MIYLFIIMSSPPCEKGFLRGTLQCTSASCPGGREEKSMCEGGAPSIGMRRRVSRWSTSTLLAPVWRMAGGEKASGRTRTPELVTVQRAHLLQWKTRTNKHYCIISAGILKESFLLFVLSLNVTHVLIGFRQYGRGVYTFFRSTVVYRRLNSWINPKVLLFLQ